MPLWATTIDENNTAYLQGNLEKGKSYVSSISKIYNSHKLLI